MFKIEIFLNFINISNYFDTMDLNISLSNCTTQRFHCKIHIESGGMGFLSIWFLNICLYWIQALATFDLRNTWDLRLCWRWILCNEKTSFFVDMNQPLEMSDSFTRKTEVRLKRWATSTENQTKNCHSRQDHHHSSLLFTRCITRHMKNVNVFLCEISDFRRSVVEACPFMTCYVTWSDTKPRTSQKSEVLTLIYIQGHLFLPFVINIILQ